MNGASELWIQVKEQFHNDIKKYYEKNGKLDLVIFSGDLTQKADPKEFEAVIEEIHELWELFKSLGEPPKLFVIPGNHDLTRPGADSALLPALDNWRKRETNIKSLLEKDEHPFRKEIKAAFQNYTSFIEKLSDNDIPLLIDHHGVIPGDCSGVLETNGLKIGLVGLNTAWSQLESTKTKGELEFSHSQLHKAVNQSISKWTQANDINILVTHHPVNWLTKAAIEEFNDEVNPLDRFDAHLFGHMHEHDARIQEYSQSSRKRDIQVASLFGLEKVGIDKTDRAHGFYFAKVIGDSNQLLMWPRIANKINAGGWRIFADNSALPEGGDCITHTFHIKSYSKKKP